MIKIETSIGYRIIQQWMQNNNMQPFAFQKKAWEAIHHQQSGIINAPTG